MIRANGKRLAALGVMVVGAGILAVTGLFFLLGDPPWERHGLELVVMMEDGARLRRGDRVVLHGVDVGSVQSVELLPPREVAVRLRLRQGIVLPADTRATVQTDIFGTGEIDLLPGLAVVSLEEGDTISGSMMTPLPQLMTDIGDRAGSLLESAEYLLSESAVEDLHATSAILPASVAALRDAFTELHHATIALRRTLEGIEENEPGAAMASSLEELEGGARALGRAAHAMEESLIPLASVIRKVDEGNGTLGRLVNDTTLFHELTYTLKEIRTLAVDLREHPKRYFGISIF